MTIILQSIYCICFEISFEWIKLMACNNLMNYPTFSAMKNYKLRSTYCFRNMHDLNFPSFIYVEVMTQLGMREPYLYHKHFYNNISSSMCCEEIYHICESFR